jgi:superfamily II DNA/RNA helicase
MKAQGIEFPDLAAPKAKLYSMDAKLSKVFYQTVFYLTDDDKINYYRYQAIRFLKAELREQYYDQAVLVSNALAGIMKTMMIKRLESSFTAFKISLNNLANATGRMIEMFEKNKVLIAPDLRVNDLMEAGASIEDIEAMIQRLNEENPQGRNNIFTTEDFDSSFLEGLRKDYQLLQELIKEWGKVKEDPKLETFLKVLKEELLNSSLNQSGKLVIFTESTDTADYLTEQIQNSLKTAILNVSSDNRSKMFETIQENFDANYTGEQKSNFNILVTTDVLAEGVNMHRANVVVNYDTPWNATRLMQRIGRVNRIGSTADVIHNFNFYPSQQGDEEIKLYSNALIKLQAHHTAFGEDAQVFTHEEMLEQFELFKEGMPDDEDKRLQYLRLIRDFKDNNPKEFKRIKHFPLKARTSRSNKYAHKEGAKQTTIVFLKSAYKMEFYQIDMEEKVSPLSFLEAAEIFEAKASEPDCALPEHHFTHVQAALKTFDEDFLGSSTEAVTITDKADAISAQAKKFLRDIKGLTKRDEIKTLCETLSTLVDKGTFTPLPNELRKLRQQLDKRQITYGQLDNLLVIIAKKYDAFDSEDANAEVQQTIDTNVAPEIVLSETFID